MLLKLVKVRGHSMEPTLIEGSFFIASSIKYFFKSPQIDDIILFKFNKEYLVKRIVKIEKDKYFLDGDNRSDSLPIMPINRQQILAKLIFKL